MERGHPQLQAGDRQPGADAAHDEAIPVSDQPEGYARLLDLADRLIANGDKAPHVSASECHEISAGIGDLCREVGSLRAEIARLLAIVNIPQVDEIFASVRIEAAHQIQRWGVEHDAGKRPENWVTLVVYLLGKASKAHFDGDEHKLHHHVVTLAAVALNWHRNITGDNADMRPGIRPDGDSRDIS